MRHTLSLLLNGGIVLSGVAIIHISLNELLSGKQRRLRKLLIVA